jgi:putative molybdopterin biosynthesis protein
MNDIATALRSLARQEQFLDVVDRDTATVRFHRHLDLRPLGVETVPLSQARGRVLARAVVADVDVHGFDRSSVDGFAIHADDTVGATERAPKTLALNREILTPGTVPQLTVAPGTATLIATGGMVPRGADAVIMVEHTEKLDALEALHPGELRRILEREIRRYWNPDHDDQVDDAWSNFKAGRSIGLAVRSTSVRCVRSRTKAVRFAITVQ